MPLILSRKDLRQLLTMADVTEARAVLIRVREGKFSKEKIYADLGEIVLGRKPARTREDEIALFESVGFALEDLVVASLAYGRANEKGVGLKFTHLSNLMEKVPRFGKNDQ